MMVINEEMVEAGARAMAPMMEGSQEDMVGRGLPDKRFDELTPDWQERYREYARACLTAALKVKGGEDVQEREEPLLGLGRADEEG